MSGSSSVGQASVYEAGDQRNSKESETKHAERYHEGQKNSHLANDSSTFFPFSAHSTYTASFHFSAFDRDRLGEIYERKGEMYFFFNLKRSQDRIIQLT